MDSVNYLKHFHQIARSKGAASDHMADAQPAEEGSNKRKLNQLRPKTRKKLKQQLMTEQQLSVDEKQRRQEQKRRRVSSGSSLQSGHL